MMSFEPRKGDCLLVVDLQPDFADPWGSLYVKGGEEIREPILRGMEKFETVVATQDWHPRVHISFASQYEATGKKPFDEVEIYGKPQTLWPDHCVQQSEGAMIPLRLANRADLILRKGANPLVDSYSAFNENYGKGGSRAPTGLLGWMLSRVVRRVVLCGLARDYCVKWSALDCSPTIPTVFLWDLTRAVNPENDAATELDLRKGGVEIIK